MVGPEQRCWQWRGVALLALLSVLVLPAARGLAADPRAATLDGQPPQLQAARQALANSDFERAFDLAAPLADSGLAEAQLLLGRLHMRREFAGHDLFEAFRLTALAAQQGLASAQHDLAEMYRAGVGVERDHLAAFSWHLRAARQRLRASELAISAMYAAGEGVERSDTQAARWASRAARTAVEAGAAPPRRPTQVGAAGTLELPGAASATSTVDAEGAPEVPAAPRAAGTVADRPAAPPGTGMAPAAGNSAARVASGRVASGRVASGRHRDAGPTGPTSTPAPAEQGGRFRVQLGAYSQLPSAESARARILAALPEALRQRYAIDIGSADLGDGRGLLHRIQAGPLADLGTARFVCTQLSTRLPEQGCFVRELMPP